MAKRNKKEKIKAKKFTFDDLELILLSLPTVIWFVIFSYLPMIGIVLAFKEYRMKAGKNFFYNMFTSKSVGLNNFKFLLASPQTSTFFRNTILYNILFIVLGIVVPVALALMISNIYSKKYQKVTQTCMFLPHFMSWVVASYFFFAFLSPDKGLVNNMITSLGGEAINWYSKDAVGYWPFIIVFANIWKGTGYGMVVYLASISGIDTTYYEAAVIDGATKWQQTTKITIPLLKQIIIIMFIMSVGRIFSSDFGLFYQLPKGQGALFDATLTIDVYIFNAIKGGGKPGMTAAAGLFQSVFGFITIMIANAIVRKIDEESAFF